MPIATGSATTEEDVHNLQQQVEGSNIIIEKSFTFSFNLDQQETAFF